LPRVSLAAVSSHHRGAIPLGQDRTVSDHAMSPALATVLLVLLAGILFVLPLLPALIELRLKRDAHPLNVIQEYSGEIRHFSYGFRVYIQALLEPLEKCVVSGTAMKGAMPDGDEYLLLGHAGAALFSSAGKKTPNCASIVAAGVDMVLPDGVTFTKEVYAANKLTSGKRNVFRALLGENDIHLGRATTINRWAHAVGALRAEPDCDLHGRISSDLEIQLESGCAFQRLNAPCIALGYSKVEVPDDVAETGEISLPIGRRLVDEDLEIKAGEAGQPTTRTPGGGARPHRGRG